jgi:long-chain fatty acid transport protein
LRKILVVLCVAGFIVSLASPLMAGGIVNKQNFSAEYLRTFSRNAATDASDAMVYNPAGVMKMEDGFYGNLCIFYALKDYNNEIEGTDYGSDVPSIVPGLFALYKQDRWAGFFAFTIPSGGGEVNYKDGDATTYNTASELIDAIPFYDDIDDMSLEAESVYYGYTVGGAYEINDILSVAAGLRYVVANKAANGTIAVSGPSAFAELTVDYEQTASGWGAFLGLNYTPREDLNFGFRYETATELDFETDVNRDDSGTLVDGSKEREDLPGLIGLGAAYTINPNIKLDLSFTYYLEKSANWEGRLEDEGDSWDLAIAAEYTFYPQLRASFGYMLTKTGIDADAMLPENPELDVNTICGGVAWEPKDNMTLNFALVNSFYDSETNSSGVKYEKNVFGVGFGIEYKFK